MSRKTIQDVFVKLDEMQKDLSRIYKAKTGIYLVRTKNKTIEQVRSHFGL